MCEALAPLVVQLRNLDEAIARLERTIAKLAQKDETARRLMSIPGFGPITASAMAATVQDTSSFAGPREFAAFLGLTPKQNSLGGKQKLGRISKMGNRNLRKLLVVGAHAANRRRIRCVVLLPPRIGLHISRGHHARLMAEPDQLACPVMRRSAGLEPHKTGGQRSKKLQQLVAPYRFGDHHPPRGSTEPGSREAAAA